MVGGPYPDVLVQELLGNALDCDKRRHRVLMKSQRLGAEIISKEDVVLLIELPCFMPRNRLSSTWLLSPKAKVVSNESPLKLVSKRIPMRFSPETGSLSRKTDLPQSR